MNKLDENIETLQEPTASLNNSKLQIRENKKTLLMTRTKAT